MLSMTRRSFLQLFGAATVVAALPFKIPEVQAKVGSIQPTVADIEALCEPEVGNLYIEFENVLDQGSLRLWASYISMLVNNQAALVKELSALMSESPWPDNWYMPTSKLKVATCTTDFEVVKLLQRWAVHDWGSCDISYTSNAKISYTSNAKVGLVHQQKELASTYLINIDLADMSSTTTLGSFRVDMDLTFRWDYWVRLQNEDETWPT